VPLFTSGGLGLIILVVDLRIWSCLHQCFPQKPCMFFAFQATVQSVIYWHHVDIFRQNLALCSQIFNQSPTNLIILNFILM